MARYDVYRHDDSGTLLLDVQADILEQFGTRVVIPLLPRRPGLKPDNRLHPTVEVNGSIYFLATHLLNAVPTAVLQTPVGKLRQEHFTIINALDRLFGGI
ncbi:plasmid maintenance protein CcdB [Aerophototrophica crusticola]|uniref:Toxin CcdB n=1 Tax=Aerophototrophica crusticola TaxID=1709002 RepID=A0A858R9X4_9PROT|nr:plasmid maintenance protein CcdB [Rhodospirillaceae bacterium B3]